MLQTNAYEQAKNFATLSQNANSVLSTLIYFDIFNYPLTAFEVFERSTLKDVDDAVVALLELHQLKIVFCIKGFYTLQNNELLITRRLTANAFAAKSLHKAKLVSRLIKRLPYVRGIMLSGSIAKNYMDKDSDIDYFIVTAPNRLWVCRLFFILVQKVVFLNMYKYFCYNYMVDENHVSITDKSLYTAIEGSTVMPVYNIDMYQQFAEKNAWMQVFFPNYPRATEALLSNNRSKLQQCIELFFNNRFGEWLDVFLMKRIEKKWKKAYSKKMFQGTNNLYLNRHTAKAHTEGHYNRIMTLYHDKKKLYEAQYNIVFKETTNFITPIKTNA